MSPRRARAADWRAVAEVRNLQSRAAEMATVEAAATRGRAETKVAEAEQTLGEAQRGWAAALSGAFDPTLARHWFAYVGARQADADKADEALREADERLDARRREWHAAELRAEAAEGRRGRASKEAAQARGEVRLGELEDRAARNGGLL